VIYQDADLVVCDKPPNCLSVPGASAGTLDSLAVRVARQFALPRVDRCIVHRLDFATSGVVVFARNDRAQSLLQRQFQTAGTVVKEYVAVVRGHPVPAHGRFDEPIGPDSDRVPLSRVDRSTTGRPAVTHYTVLRLDTHPTFGPVSVVQLRPLTGRRHQLRVHCHAHGHPILGDALYWPDDDLARCASSASRLCLHAERLTLTHPTGGATVTFEAPAPRTLAEWAGEFRR
jgi:tRNA pseudouridine32 synthase/23S rRNA pseudouridine746 synthase